MHPCGLCGSPYGLCSSDRCECNIPTIVEFDHSEYNPSKGYFLSCTLQKCSSHQKRKMCSADLGHEISTESREHVCICSVSVAV